jgi:hypothetical protein
MNRFILDLLGALLFVAGLGPSYAHTNSITYQGQLRQTNEPFTGTANLLFRLLEQPSGGSQIGSPQTIQNVDTDNGLFQVEMDYDRPDLDGRERYLEVRVNGTPFSPRQKASDSPSICA